MAVPTTKPGNASAGASTSRNSSTASRRSAVKASSVAAPGTPRRVVEA